MLGQRLVRKHQSACESEVLKVSGNSYLYSIDFGAESVGKRGQLLKVASSISLNLSEGNAKTSVKEKKRFYQMAYASAQECKTVLRLLKCEDVVLAEKADRLSASLYKLMKSEITSILNSEQS